VVVQPSGLTADITPASLTVSGITANNKVYDATKAASLDTTGAALSGVLGGDSVTLNAGSTTGSFADKSVGTYKSVSVSAVSLSGADSGNYTVSNPGGITADITPASLTVSATNKSKTEGSALVFAGTEFTSSGLIGGETIASVTLNSAGAPAPAPAGSYSITPSAAVAGAGFVATNYAISYVPAMLVVAAAPTSPPAAAPAPTPAPMPAPVPRASRIEQVVVTLRNESRRTVVAALAELDASLVKSFVSMLVEEDQKQAQEGRKGTDKVFYDQCPR
jgi:hypothetical protein